MPKVIVEFDLPTEDDAFREVMQADRMACAIRDFHDWLIFSKFKHRELDDEQRQLLDEIRNLWLSSMEGWEIDVWQG